MAKIKVKSVSKTLQNEDVQSMFQNVLGTDGTEQDLQQIWPKFKHVRHNVRRFVKMVSWLGARQELERAGFTVEVKNIQRYAAQLVKEEDVFSEVPSLDPEGTDESREDYLDFVDTDHLDRLPDEVVEKVKRALLGFDPVGRDAEGLYHWERTEMVNGFVEAHDSDYASLREWSIRLGLLDAVEK